MNRYLILFLLILFSCKSENSNKEYHKRDQRTVAEDSMRINLQLDSLMQYKYNISRYLGFLNYYLLNHNEDLRLNKTYYKENRRFVQEMNFKNGYYSTVMDTSEITTERISSEVKYLDSLLKENKVLVDSSLKELVRVTKKEK